MDLYIGGQSQGKLNYVLTRTGWEKEIVIDGATEEAEDILAFKHNYKNKKIWNHFHLWFRNQLLEGANPEETVKELLEQYEDMIIISNEVGNGIVPIDKAEREYRERLGRCLCSIAEKAVSVERILCGMGQKLV